MSTYSVDHLSGLLLFSEFVRRAGVNARTGGDGVGGRWAAPCNFHPNDSVPRTSGKTVHTRLAVVVVAEGLFLYIFFFYVDESIKKKKTRETRAPTHPFLAWDGPGQELRLAERFRCPFRYYFLYVL